MIHRNSLLIGLILGSIVAAILYFFVLERPADAAEAPRLSFPVDCVIGQDCWYMAFVDMDSRSTYRDHMCGVRTYDAHKGTDIAPDLSVVNTLTVLAAAAGRVIGTRDGLDDSPMETEDSGRDAARCGNGVRVDHGDGWTTQYCHMAQGSVTVSTGDMVEAGHKLGQIGSSGWSELPHLHFQLEKDGAPVDPFLGTVATTNDQCLASRGLAAGLWHGAGARNAESYQPVHIRKIGLTTATPTREIAKFGGYPKTANPDAGVLVAYVVLFGAPAGAKIETLVEGPAGQTIFANEKIIERDFAEYFSFAGRKRNGQEWPTGVYTTRVEVSGNGPVGPFAIRAEADLIIQ